LFLSHRTGNNVLYRMRPDGTEVTPVFGGEVKDVPGLGEGATWHREPHWSRLSPDGRLFLSYAIDRGFPAARHRAPPRFLVHLGRTAGGPTRILTPDAGEVFAWSPDGRAFAYARSLWGHPATISHPVPPRTQVVVARIDGSAEDVVLDRPGAWVPHDWSPDGKRLLLSYQSSPILQRARSAVFELDLAAAQAAATAGRAPAAGGPAGDPEGGGLRAVLPPAAGLGKTCRYAPDGKSVAWVGSALVPKDDGLIDPKAFAGGFAVEVHDLAAGRTRPAHQGADVFGGPICWSPDGREILFARFADPDAAAQPDPDPAGDVLAIWAVRPDGTGLRKVGDGWCPDWRVGRE
jgi:hypothetical protein